MPFPKVVSIYQGHTKRVRTISWSPDSTKIASAGLDQTVQIWNVKTGESIVQYLHHATTINDVAWSPTGRSIASADSDAVIRLWQPFDKSNEIVYQARSGWIAALSWSPEEHYLASVGGCLAEVRNISTGAIVRQFSHTFPINDVAWMPRGERVALACEDAIVNIWNVRTNKITILGTRDIVFAVAWSPDSHYLAATCFDGSIFVYDTMKQELFAEYRPDTGQVFAVAWSPDGHYLAYAGEKGIIHIWDIFHAPPFQDVAHSAAIFDVAWSPDGRYLAFASFDHSVQVLEMLE